MTSRLPQSPLVSNGYTLAMTPERLGWLVPTTPELPIDRLREQYQTQGYLYLKGVLDRKEVLEFRRFFFKSFENTGLLAPGSDAQTGLYAGGGEQKAVVNQHFWEIVRSSEYAAFCTMPRLWNFYTAFFEDEPYLHKRKIIRYNVPNERNCTGGHYDLVYLRAGTDRICSSWIPIGDTPIDMGGLVYLEGSDAVGRRMEAEFRRKNADLSTEEQISAYNKNMRADGWVSSNLPEMAERFHTRWLVADYEAGDMVIHSPYMIHAATTNTDKHGHIRLSTDIRYQRASDPIDRRWSNDWDPRDQL